MTKAELELIAHATLHIAHGFNVNKLKFSPDVVGWNTYIGLL